MAESIAIDSNVLTYLVEVTEPGYDPAKDRPELAAERIAMLRVFLYGGRDFWVSPTVKREYGRIRNQAWLSRHDSLTGVLLLDQDLNVSDDTIDRRVAELVQHHRKTRNCRILAEAELMGLRTLLSFDPKLANRLGPHTNVQIISPSGYWRLLNVPVGARPVWSPAPLNPLAGVGWWRL